MLECRLNVGTVEGFNKMKSIFKVTTVFLALVLLTGCFGEEEKVKAPKKDYIVVKNDSVENFEVKLQTRLKNRVLIPFNETVKIDFLATKTKTVLVQTKSQDPNWNNCSIAMQVGQTLIVYRKYESIECRAE
jgi:hypothetical protein